MKTMRLLVVMVVAMVLLPELWAQQADRPCANLVQGGVSDPPCNGGGAGNTCATGGAGKAAVCPTGNTPAAGVGRLNPYTGNAHEAATDLEVWGGVGQVPLVWRRYFNSRYVANSQRFGDGGNWRHEYQWNVAGLSGSGGRQLWYPDGRVIAFTSTNINNQSVYVAGPAVTDRLYPEAGGFVLRRANG